MDEDDADEKIESYKDLRVWRLSVMLTKECYILTRTFPKEEMFGLTSQIRRAATSVPANIAEGNGRENTGDYIRFLRISRGSLKELETHLIIAHEVGICKEEQIQSLLQQANDLGRMIRALIRSLQRKLANIQLSEKR